MKLKYVERSKITFSKHLEDKPLKLFNTFSLITNKTYYLLHYNQSMWLW